MAVFAQGSTDVAWSSYRGSWQLIEIETNTWSWPQGCGIWLAIVFGPILYFGAAIWLSTHGLVRRWPGCFPSWRDGSVSCAGGLILINIDDALTRSSIWNHANDPLS
jgi:hypothetical protein